jgi:hypothetical protein
MNEKPPPTFDEMRDEQARFIGPPPPPTIPKFTPKDARQAVQQRMLQDLAKRIAVQTEAARKSCRGRTQSPKKRR